MANTLAVFALIPADEIVGRAVRKVLDRLDGVFAERDQHPARDAWNFPKSIGNAEFLALGIEFGLDASFGGFIDAHGDALA
jgi:hypothetical protein